MFGKSLDNKNLYINRDGIEMVDIMDTIYTRMYNLDSVHSVYRANKQCEMRPDYLSACLYGDEAYAEITIKSAMLSNPFALEMGDLVFAMTVDNIYNDVKDFLPDKNSLPSVYELVKRYHKYIDKDKVPEADGSEENKVAIPSAKAKPALEPNISKTGATGIVIKNGKIYFGKNKSEEDRIPDKVPEDISDGISALNTGSFPSDNYPEEGTTEDDDYMLEAMLRVNDEDDSLEFDLDDDVVEDFGNYAAANVATAANNIILDGTKVYFEEDKGEGDNTGNVGAGDGTGEGNEPGTDNGGDNGISDIESGLIIPTNSDEVDCAKSGISLGKFLSSSVSSCK